MAAVSSVFEFLKRVLRLPAAAAVLLALAGTAVAQAQAAADFDLPAQPLEQSLRQVADSQKLQMVYVRSDIEGVRAPAVRGRYTPTQVVEKLTEGTQLAATFNGRDTVVIKPKAADKGGQAANPTLLAQAQSAERQATSTGSNDRTVRGEGMVVTAQKRNELLIDVPQSVTVLTGDELARLGAVQFRDFAARVPGMSFATLGAGFTQVTLRGVTAGIDLGPTVGIYLDEVPYGSSSSLTFSSRLPLDVGLFDLDRIEVLRGPQGTLYGASSMGGLLKYVSRRPDPTRFGVNVQAGVSNTDDGGTNYNVAAAVNAPLADRVALRASAYHSRDDGFIDNVRSGQEDVDASKISGGRLDLMFNPTNALGVRLAGFVQELSRDGRALADYRTAGGEPVDGPLDQRRILAEPFDQRFHLISGTVTYDLGYASLTSITAYQSGKTDFWSDSSASFLPTPIGAPYSAWGTLSHQTTDRFTQELRLQRDGARPLEWLVGAFYSDEETDLRQAYSPRDMAGQPAPNTFYDFSSPTTVEEAAVFGDLTWYLSDKFDVTGGIRFARYRGTFETVGTGSLGVPRALTRSSENITTYLANARYHFSDLATGYLRYATGYRPGGPNFTVIDPATGLLVGPDTFDSDSLSSYEIGYKAETADRRFAVDAAAYYIDWQDIQIARVLGGAAYRTNAEGGAEIRGGELSVTARPIQNLTLTGAFAYTDAKLKEAQPALGAASGARLPNVPRNTATVDAEYTLPMGSLRPTFGASVRYVSDRRAAVSPTAYQLPEYTSVDLRAGVMLGSVSLQLYAHNITNEYGQLSQALSTAAIAGVTQVAILRPRTIGITATTRF